MNQQQLPDKQTRNVQVHLMLPDSSDEAIQRGQSLAQQIREELKTRASGSLEETMASLRGRSCTMLF